MNTRGLGGALLVWVVLGGLACAEEVRLEVGMKRDEAVALIQRHGGRDLTPHLALGTTKGRRPPPEGVCWEFADHDAVVMLFAQDGKLTGMTWWTKKDFHESKSRRAAAAQEITALVLDTRSRRVTVRK